MSLFDRDGLRCTLVHDVHSALVSNVHDVQVSVRCLPPLPQLLAGKVMTMRAEGTEDEEERERKAFSLCLILTDFFVVFFEAVSIPIPKESQF